MSSAIDQVLQPESNEGAINSAHRMIRLHGTYDLVVFYLTKDNYFVADRSNIGVVSKIVEGMSRSDLEAKFSQELIQTLAKPANEVVTSLPSGNFAFWFVCMSTSGFKVTPVVAPFPTQLGIC